MELGVAGPPGAGREDKNATGGARPSGVSGGSARERWGGRGRRFIFAQVMRRDAMDSTLSSSSFQHPPVPCRRGPPRSGVGPHSYFFFSLAGFSRSFLFLGDEDLVERIRPPHGFKLSSSRGLGTRVRLELETLSAARWGRGTKQGHTRSTPMRRAFFVGFSPLRDFCLSNFN